MESRGCSMPERLCDNAISEITGKKRGNFYAFAELKKKILQKGKDLEILIQHKINSLLKKLKL
jgi:hypothetical protein